MHIPQGTRPDAARPGPATTPVVVHAPGCEVYQAGALRAADADAWREHVRTADGSLATVTHLWLPWAEWEADARACDPAWLTRAIGDHVLAYRVETA